MNYQDPKLRNALAGEYVLGTLHGKARARFEKLLQTDPALLGEVESWQAKLYPMVDGLEESPPPERVWKAVRARVASRPTTVPTRRTTTFWRLWAGMATAVALVMAIALGASLRSPPATTYVVVVTSDANAKASWVLSGHSESGTLRVRTLSPQSIASDRAFQLWVLPANESTVRPVGLLPSAGDTDIVITAKLAAVLAMAQKVGVSIEAPTGSATGQPTTTPLYHGTPIAL
ncbi:MAG: anti-sigma factor [Gammaproteobacteria bacterium]|nr:anti-sigma factor [Gammaproteobacteria bacterium]